MFAMPFFCNWHKHFITDKQFCQITSRRYQNWQFLLPNLHVNELSDDAAHCYSSVWLEVAYFMFSAQLCPVKHCRGGEGCGRQQLGLENKKLRAENTADLSAFKLEAWWKCLAGASRVCPSSWHAACLSPGRQGAPGTTGCPGTEDKTESCPLQCRCSQGDHSSLLQSLLSTLHLLRTRLPCIAQPGNSAWQGCCRLMLLLRTSL